MDRTFLTFKEMENLNIVPDKDAYICLLSVVANSLNPNTESIVAILDEMEAKGVPIDEEAKHLVAVLYMSNKKEPEQIFAAFDMVSKARRAKRFFCLVVCEAKRS